MKYIKSPTAEVILGTILLVLSLQLLTNIGGNFYTMSDFVVLIIICLPSLAAYLYFKFIKINKGLFILLVVLSVLLAIIGAFISTKPSGFAFRVMTYLLMIGLEIILGRVTYKKEKSGDVNKKWNQKS
ncbi:MAG: hypothetical protein ACI31W_03730 [Lactococcus sp.]